MRGTVTVRGMMVLVASLVAAGLGGQSARGAEGSAAKAAPAGRATIDTTPEQYYQGAQGNAARRMTGKYTGNSWTWHARFPMHGFLDAYLATRDPAWLDAAAKYFDWNVGLLLVGPDGFQGWLGPVSGAPDKLSEHPIGDAIMLEPP